MSNTSQINALRRSESFAQELGEALQIIVSDARRDASLSEHAHIDLMVELYESGMLTSEQLIHEVTP